MFPTGTPPRKYTNRNRITKESPQGKDLAEPWKKFVTRGELAVIEVHRTFHSDNLSQKEKKSWSIPISFLLPRIHWLEIYWNRALLSFWLVLWSTCYHGIFSCSFGWIFKISLTNLRLLTFIIVCGCRKNQIFVALLRWRNFFLNWQINFSKRSVIHADTQTKLSTDFWVIFVDELFSSFYPRLTSWHPLIKLPPTRTQYAAKANTNWVHMWRSSMIYARRFVKNAPDVM